MSLLAEQINESLNNVGYFAPYTENAELLDQMVNTDLVEYAKLVSYLSKELSRLCRFEDYANSIESANDQSTFYLEIASFLKQMSCPIKFLTEGPIDERFKTTENKLELLDYLVTEFQAARMMISNKPELASIDSSNAQQSDESEEAKAVKKILISLGFSKPPPNVSSTEIWSKIESKCREILSKLPKSYLGLPLLNAMLNNDQWKKLMHINQALNDDFQMRRELLLTRLDVTIQSFKWADRLKQKNQEIAALYQQKRKELSFRPSVKLYHILAARDDLLKQEKTCSSRFMTKSQLHKIIIPKVPDRGGRTGELEPPPPEMPSFMKRQPQHQQPQRQQESGGRGGHRGNYQGGGRNNNNWSNDQQGFRPKSDFEQFQQYQDPNYNQSRGGGQSRGGRGGHRNRH